MLTLTQAADKHNVGRDRLYRAAMRGDLPYEWREVEWHSRPVILVREEDVAEFLAGKRARKSPERPAEERKNRLGLIYSDSWVQGRMPGHIRARLGIDPI